MDISSGMKSVGAGRSAHVDVSAAGGTLLRVVHRSIYAKLLDRFRGRRRDGLADRQVRGCRALHDFRSRIRSESRTGVVHNTCRGHLAGALPVEQITGVDSVKQEAVARVALAVGPDGLVTQTTVRASARGQLRIHTRR